MKRLSMFFAFTLVMSAFQLGGAGLIAAHADSKTINFENPPYSPGSTAWTDGAQPAPTIKRSSPTAFSE